MIILLKPDVSLDGSEIEQILRVLRAYPGVTTRTHAERGQTRSVIEVHVIGNTAAIPKEPLEELPGVQQVVRVSDRYRLIGRHKGQVEGLGFEYNGVRFDQETLHVFAGLCAVDSREHTEQTMRALHQAGLVTTRMGAYKPRTSPYDFQGYGRECLPYVFDLAGKYGVRVIAMEVTHEQQIAEIRSALRAAGDPTGVMLQIGTRNAQNFELLKVVGQQTEFPMILLTTFAVGLSVAIVALLRTSPSGTSCSPRSTSRCTVGPTWCAQLRPDPYRPPTSPAFVQGATDTWIGYVFADGTTTAGRTRRRSGARDRRRPRPAPVLLPHPEHADGDFRVAAVPTS